VYAHRSVNVSITLYIVKSLRERLFLKLEMIAYMGGYCKGGDIELYYGTKYNIIKE
jgi:hypothetical protein